MIEHVTNKTDSYLKAKAFLLNKSLVNYHFHARVGYLYRQKSLSVSTSMLAILVSKPGHKAHLYLMRLVFTQRLSHMFASCYSLSPRCTREVDPRFDNLCENGQFTNLLVLIWYLTRVQKLRCLLWIRILTTALSTCLSAEIKLTTLKSETHFRCPW